MAAVSADISGKVSKVSDGDSELERVIIEGSLLVFCLGEWTDDGELIALGRLRDQSPASQMRFKERIEASHAGLQHRNILPCFGYITIGDIVYSVNPWIANGNIRDYIRENPDADRLRLLGEVASGVEFLHKRRIAHGDLCGKNILINGDGRAVVYGFGLTECSNQNLDLSRVRWFAPEKITSASVSLPTEKGDIWSFALLCLEVFTGEDPYSSSPDLFVPVLLNRGETPEHPGSKAVGLSPNMWELMQSCWKVDPAERPSMSTIQSTILEMRPRRNSRQGSSRSLDQPIQTPLTWANDSVVSTGASFGTTPSSPSPQSTRTPTEDSPLTSKTRELNLSALLLGLPIEAIDQQTETPIQTWHSTPSSGSGRLAPLVEEPLDLETGAPSTPPSSVRGRQSRSHPYTAPSPSTSSAPPPSHPIPSAPQRQLNADSLSLQSTSGTRGSGTRRRWSIMSHIRSRTTLNTTPDVNGSPLPPRTPNSDTLPVQKRAPQVRPPTRSRAQTAPTSVPNAEAPQISQSATSLVPLLRSRRREPLSPVVLEFLEKVANDSECLARQPAASVSAGNLEDLISRVITNTSDPFKDNRYSDAFLTVYQLFATSERLFEILKRRFGSMELDPRERHIRSRFNILLFIDRWLKKGFEDEELKCSATIKQFALAVRGSGTMEVKAQEIASLIDNPDYVRLRQPGSCARLRREPAERPQGLTPADLATVLTVVEGERFKYITHWDYANFILGRSNAQRRIEAFNAVHDLVTVWVKQTVLDSDDLGKRMKKYEEWIHAAKECRIMNNFSSTAAIVNALTSSAIARLVLTCESEAKPILHELAREVAPTDGVYQNTLRQVTAKDLIPWLDPLLPPLNSTFALSNLIIEVDGRPLIDFKQCIRLAEQIDSLVRYSPPLNRSAMRSEVLAYVEYNLKSCDRADALRWVETRSNRLIGEERTLLDRRRKMRSLRMKWAPSPTVKVNSPPHL